MREIKFRAFCEVSGKYQPTYNDPLFPHIFWQLVYKGSFDTPVQQYTGLTDCNGKEIYEGDIIETEDTIRYVVCYGEHPTDIYEIYHYGWFLVNLNDYKANYCAGFSINNNIIYTNIIGNIYENKDLLKEIEE